MGDSRAGDSPKWTKRNRRDEGPPGFTFTSERERDPWRNNQAGTPPSLSPRQLKPNGAGAAALPPSDSGRRFWGPSNQDTSDSSGSEAFGHVRIIQPARTPPATASQFALDPDRVRRLHSLENMMNRGDGATGPSYLPDEANSIEPVGGRLSWNPNLGGPSAAAGPLVPAEGPLRKQTHLREVPAPSLLASSPAVAQYRIFPESAGYGALQNGAFRGNGALGEPRSNPESSSSSEGSLVFQQSRVPQQNRPLGYRGSNPGGGGGGPLGSNALTSGERGYGTSSAGTQGAAPVTYPIVGQSSVQRRLAIWDEPSTHVSSESSSHSSLRPPAKRMEMDGVEQSLSVWAPQNHALQRLPVGARQDGAGPLKPIPYPEVGQYSHASWLSPPVPPRPEILGNGPPTEPMTPTLSQFGIQSESMGAVSPRFANGAPEPDRGSEASWWRQLYRIDWKPKEVFLKYRKRIMGCRIGANVEFRRKDWPPEEDTASEVPTTVWPWGRDLSLWGFRANDATLKLVLKPHAEDRLWKLLVEPRRGDVRFLSRKIPILGLLNIQVGVGHDFRTKTTGWKWKVTSRFGGGAAGSQIGYKGMLHLCPGLDARIGLNADYVLPDMQGSIGTGEPIMGLNLGQLYASIERIEAIFSSYS